VKNQNNEYEGKSHDVVDNKGSNFLSHDVYENKGCYAVYPTIFMKPNELSLSFRRYSSLDFSIEDRQRAGTPPGVLSIFKNEPRKSFRINESVKKRT
jgi:hypothetical protein